MVEFRLALTAAWELAVGCGLVKSTLAACRRNSVCCADYETLGTLPLKLGWDERDTSGRRCGRQDMPEAICRSEDGTKNRTAPDPLVCLPSHPSVNSSVPSVAVPLCWRASPIDVLRSYESSAVHLSCRGTRRRPCGRSYKMQKV